MSDNKPPPGSSSALVAGCKCPVLDNAHGKGRYGDGEKYGWWIVKGCPLHDATRTGRDEPKAENNWKPWPDKWPERFNGGIRCDMLIGPCACGATHDERDAPDPPDCLKDDCPMCSPATGRDGGGE